MTEAVTAASLEETERLFESFHALVTGGLEPELAPARLGKLAAFAGVRDYPVRIKCATLPWHTLRAASRAESTRVTTE
jgi:nitrogen fixation NifU-like protein